MDIGNQFTLIFVGKGSSWHKMDGNKNKNDIMFCFERDTLGAQKDIIQVKHNVTVCFVFYIDIIANYYLFFNLAG